MIPRITFTLVLLLGLASLARAEDVTTYGAGLKSCSDYVAAREQDSPQLVAYIDWLSGYLSGVNTTSTHRNNFLSHEDLAAALAWLSDYCQLHASKRLAEATWTLVAGAKTGPSTHSVEVTAYGSGYKSCATYRQAREEQTLELNVDNTEFIAWLGGYLSGVNAMSLSSNNVLGILGLGQATRWLDDFCSDHTEVAFGAAVGELIANTRSAEAAPHLADASGTAASGQAVRATRATQARSP
jgi:hypothetical protein